VALGAGEGHLEEALFLVQLTGSSAQTGCMETKHAVGFLSTQFHPENQRKADPAFNAIFTYFLGQAGAK